MSLHSTLFCLLLSIALLSGLLLPDGRKIRRPGKEDPEGRRKTQTRIQGRKQRSVRYQDECQEGNPLGASYLGRINVTASGITCKVWDMDYYDDSDVGMGDHNYCRNPDGDAEGGAFL